MPKNPDSKIRLLYVADYFVKFCFRKETITAQEIQEYLDEEWGITCDIKSVRDDIDILIEFGYEIKPIHGRGYRMISRPDGLVLEDLIALRDCIRVSRILPVEEQGKLIEKIGAASINTAVRELKGTAAIDTSNADEYVPVECDMYEKISIIRSALGIDEIAVSGDEVERITADGKRKVKKMRMKPYGAEAETFTVIPYMLRDAVEDVFFDYYDCDNDRYASICVRVIDTLEIIKESCRIKPEDWEKQYDKQALRDAAERAKALNKELDDNVVVLRIGAGRLDTFLNDCDRVKLKVISVNEDEEESSLFYDEIKIEAAYIEDYEEIYKLLVPMWVDAQIVRPQKAIDGMKAYLEDILDIYKSGELNWYEQMEKAKLTEFKDKFYRE